MNKQHQYSINLAWTGNTGRGTASYSSYDRAHTLTAPGKPPLYGSSDPSFRGDPTRYNPEDLLVASLSSCHMLWYLALAAAAGIVVVKYEDEATGTMIETADGGGRFADVLLRPVVTVAAGSSADVVADLHHRAHDLCFIANSVNFPVRCEATMVCE